MTLRIAVESDIAGMHAVRTSVQENRLDDPTLIQPQDYRAFRRRLHDVMMEWFFAAGAERVWLTTTPETRAEKFYAAAGWQPTGSAANGERRFEMFRPDRSA